MEQWTVLDNRYSQMILNVKNLFFLKLSFVERNSLSEVSVLLKIYWSTCHLTWVFSKPYTFRTIMITNSSKKTRHLRLNLSYGRLHNWTRDFGNTSVFIIHLKVGKQPTSTDFTLQLSKLWKDSGWFSVVLSLVTNVSSTSQESDSVRLHTLFLGGWPSLPLLRLFSVNTSLFSLADPGSAVAVKWHNGC